MIAKLRTAGVGWGTIASTLNLGKIPTPSGRGRWWPASVRHYHDPQAWAARMRRIRSR